MPLVINSLGGGQTHKHTHTDVRTETILENQAHAWFKNWQIECLSPIINPQILPVVVIHADNSPIFYPPKISQVQYHNHSPYKLP